MKVLLVSNTAWSVLNFRRGLVAALIDNGHEVVVAAPPDETVPQLLTLGCDYRPLAMDNRGTNPLRDYLLYRRLRRLYREVRPAMIWHYTIKPAIYGSLAARSLRLPSIPVITGAGHAFVRTTWLTAVVTRLYRVALRGLPQVWFLNADDRQLFIDTGMVHVGPAGVLPSEGVDTEHFMHTDLPVLPEPEDIAGQPIEPPPERTRGVVFLLLARMLWDKGIGEYVEAARRVRAHYPDAEFRLLGFLDVDNPAAIPREQMQAWMQSGVVTYLGAAADVRPFIREADCIVLPSYYREGVPRTLLEAASMARPIVTTDWIGCRDVVEDGVTGFLCRPRDATDLTDKLTRMIELGRSERARMGLRGRAKVLSQFDERIVIGKYLEGRETLEQGRTISGHAA